MREHRIECLQLCIELWTSLPCALHSRFYGPQISTLPATIQPFVEEYEKSLTFELTGDNPYLFSMASSYQYGHSSSAWSQLVKSCFQRHAGVSCPPKARNCSRNCSYEPHAGHHVCPLDT